MSRSATRRCLTGLGLDPGDLAQRADELRRDGQTVMLVAIDGKMAGLVAVADPVKEGAAEALAALRAEGLRVVMLTGDSRTTANAVGRRLGIDEIAAEILPDQKAQAVRDLQRRHHVVAMAGDGINDAPALAQADIGIAMGTGADIAIEAAALTLVKGDLSGIVRARRLSRAVMRNIRQNLFFAFIFNGLAIPIAAGALYPAFGLLLNPMIASAAMSRARCWSSATPCACARSGCNRRPLAMIPRGRRSTQGGKRPFGLAIGCRKCETRPEVANERDQVRRSKICYTS